MIQDIQMAIERARTKAQAAEAKLREVELQIAEGRQALRDVGVLAERVGPEADAVAEPLIVEANQHLRDARAAIDALSKQLSAVVQH